MDPFVFLIEVTRCDVQTEHDEQKTKGTHMSLSTVKLPISDELS